MADSLISELKTKLFSLTSQHNFLVAYSGGMDSHVLLHSLAALRLTENIQVRAVHVHHNLSSNADQWVTHCQKICSELGVELIVKYVNAKIKTKHSLEAVARKLRYQAIADVLQENECLVTAQHADDQAETFLLQSLRGSGPKGLAGMPEVKKFSYSSLLRPLLSFTRKELNDYARENCLCWVEDESNENIGIERNFVRHKLLPIVTAKWPGSIATLGRAAKFCAEASELLAELAELDYQLVGNENNTLATDKLLLLSSARQSNVLRYWMQKLDLPIPSAVKIQQIKSNVLTCARDAMPLVVWNGAEVRRYRESLYAQLPLAPHDANLEFSWDGEDDFVLPNNLGLLQTEKLENLKGKKLIIKFRTGSESCKLKGREGTHSLKKLLQEWHVPPWLRNRVPLIYSNEKLAVIVVGENYHYCV